MRALRALGPRDLQIVEVEPPSTGADEVLVAVDAVGICGTDIEILDGTMAYFTAGLARYPMTIGHEWTGRICAVGEGVSDLVPGQRVVGEVSIGCMECEVCRSGAYHRCEFRTETGVMNRDGGMAELVVLPRWAIHVVPEHVSLRAAALVEPTAIAANAVRLANPGSEEPVLIVGDGPIGLMILQVALARGCRDVVLAGGTEERMAKALALGASSVVDGRAPDVVEAIEAKFGGRRPTRILEASGTEAGVALAIAVALPGATVVLQGLLGRLPERAIDLDRIVVNDLTLRGALGSPNIWPEVIELVAGGRVEPAAIVTHELPLHAYAEAIELVRSRRAIKVILRPDHG